jgi:multidrug efflux pump subunit AcrA (membrane-fusion protein)
VTTMKFLKSLVVVLAIGGIIFLSISCAASPSAATPAKPTISTVQRGNISIAVTGTGNLAMEYKQELSFGQTGLVSQASNAKISEVMIKPGDTVKQGQVLVKADTSDLQDTLTQDQHNLDTAKANLLTAQNNLTTDQMKMSQQSDVQAIQTKIDNTNTQLLNAQAMRQQAMVSSTPNAADEVKYWSQSIDQYQADIAKYQKQISDLLADPQHYLASQVNGSASSVAAIKNLQMQIDQDQSNITLRQNTVDEAQSKLNDDKNLPQEITAPFDGLITKVSVTQGDIVQRNADLIEIAQPDKFIANIMVTERDVMSVKIGGDATVSFDALSSLNFPARITQIAPLATVQQGVVNYAVTVELTSTKPIFPNRTGASSQRTQLFQNGNAVSSSGAATTAPSGTTTPTGTPAATGNSNPPVIVPGSAFSSGAIPTLNLKDGLSATVNIVIQEKDDVLMVPSRAITRQGQNSTVQKVAGAGTQQTTVQTGITDGTNTEITSGLSEGDQVSVQPRTTSTTTTSGVRAPGGGGFVIR